MNEKKNKVDFKKLCDDKKGDETKSSSKELIEQEKQEEEKKLKENQEKEKKVAELKEQAKQVKKEEEKPENKNIGALIKTAESGLFIPKTMEEQIVVARAYLQSQMLPAHFDTVQKVVVGIQFAAELGLKPLTALRQTYIVNGSPSIFGDLPLALVEKSGLMEDFEEYLFDDKFEKICLANKNIDVNVYGAFCKVKRKSRSPVEKWFTINDAIQAKFFYKDEKGNFIANGKKDCWAKYPKLMLMYRARSMALKACFPDYLNGVSIAEYDNDVLGDKVHISEIDEEKGFLLEEVQMLLSECRKSIPEFNAAKELDLINKFIKNQDIRFGEKEDLKKLSEALREYYKTNTSPA